MSKLLFSPLGLHYICNMKMKSFTDQIGCGSSTVCACSSRNFIDKDFAAKVAAQAVKAGLKVHVVDDLCRMVQEHSSDMNQVASGAVAACHPRAVKALLASIGLESPEIYDMRSHEEQFCSTEPDKDEVEQWKNRIKALPSCYGTDAWFPSIDKTLCAECGKCLDFCPFGVYSMVDDRVTVTFPAKCKNNCPACARTCPAGAIIFPKHETGPINGGPEETMPASSAINLTATAGGSVIYADALRRRLQERRNSGIQFLRPASDSDDKDKTDK